MRLRPGRVIRDDRPLRQLAAWAARVPVIGGGLLAVLALCSALAVVVVAHRNRLMNAELQQLQAEQDRLDSDYEKLLLEQSAWTDYSRIEEKAVTELAMRSVGPDVTVIAREGPGLEGPGLEGPGVEGIGLEGPGDAIHAPTGRRN